VPRVCRWNGIIISLFTNEHGLPHFHASYAEFEAVIAIATLDVLESDLPRRVEAEVIGWARTRQVELSEAWDSCQANVPPPKIAPPR